MDTKQFPANPNLEQYKKQAKELLKAFRSANMDTLRRVRQKHPRFRKLTEAAFRSTTFALADAQLVIAREHGLESWPKFVSYMEDLARKDSPVSIFESAADAVVSGDMDALARLLREDPALIRARSPREHQSTLLHYVAANGVEDFRQKTPKNAVTVARMLLDAGAEVDAENHDYSGGGTALGLAATSYHPAKAGVQIELLEIDDSVASFILNVGVANRPFARDFPIERFCAAWHFADFYRHDLRKPSQRLPYAGSRSATADRIQFRG